MDSQILAAERAAHQQSKSRARAVFWSIIGGVVLLTCIPLAATLWAVKPVLAAFVALVFAAIIGGSLGLGTLLGKAIGKASASPFGLASPGPWSFGQVYTPLPPEQVWPAVQFAALSQNLASGPAGLTSIEFIKSTGFYTPGGRYLVDLRPSADRPGMGVVTIAARPHMAHIYHDLGTAQNTVNALLNAVPGRELPGQPAAQLLPRRPSGPQDRYRS